ncbi:hypothetical protein K470DRAFT_268901 [Piedraia hortae CBS 480.64]|uniref:Uncharacterized protein n=1 Tax=Piedraia hortae CBS 480.64 TaxID=1314780 RepID=A0A6A7C553_9PEZI|nr:hypothetical protein K470DRAFT_268901 [Piedraia hortae CBS 480.64]
MQPTKPQPDDFAKEERRAEAATVLQSYHLLSTLSFHRCESLAQTRLHLQNIIAGFTPEDEKSLVSFPDNDKPRPNDNPPVQSSKHKANKRKSSSAVSPKAKEARR